MKTTGGGGVNTNNGSAAPRPEEAGGQAEENDRRPHSRGRAGRVYRGFPPANRQSLSAAGRGDHPGLRAAAEEIGLPGEELEDFNRLVGGIRAGLQIVMMKRVAESLARGGVVDLT
jgi:hypothetical protein